jgi:hypothetical protein
MMLLDKAAGLAESARAQLHPDHLRAAVRAVHTDTWAALAVFVVAILLRLNHLGAPQDNYDEGVYTASLQSLAAGHALYAQVYCGQPPLFLLSLLPWYRLFGGTLFAARLGVVAYSLVGLVAAWWIGRMLGGRRTALITLALLAFDPLYLAQSRAVEAEAPALAFMLLAVALAVWAWRNGARTRTRHEGREGKEGREGSNKVGVIIGWLRAQWSALWRPALAGAVYAVAFLIKLFVLPAIIPIAAFLLAPVWSADAGGQRVNSLTRGHQTTSRRGNRQGASSPSAASRRVNPRLRSRSLLAEAGARWNDLMRWLRPQWPVIAASAGGFIVVVLVVFFSQANPAAEWAQVIGLHARATGAVGSRLDNFGTFAGIWWEALLVLAGLYAGYLGWRQRRCVPVVFAVWGIVSICVLAVQTPLFTHHLALIPPPFILAAALLPELAAQPQTRSVARPRLPPILRALRSLRALRVSSPPITGMYAVITALLLIAAVTSIQQQIAVQAQPPVGMLQAANDLQALTQPGDLVVTDDQMIAVVAGRAVPAPLVDTSLVRIASGSLTTRQVIAVASDPRVRAIVWYSGRFDRLLGLRAWVEANFIRIIDYGDGRALYLRAPPSIGPPKG